MSCRPPYRMVRLNGMPIQMFTRITATRASEVLVSQPGCSFATPMASRNRFKAPLSLSRIHRQTAPETISGISHGSRISDRSSPLSGKRRRKNTASARPMANCPAIEPTVNRTVFSIAWPNTGDDTTSR
jgi:hypothetical protein